MFAPAHGDRRRSIHGKMAFRAQLIFPVVRWRSDPLGARREVVRFCGAGTRVASRNGPRTNEAFRHTWAWRQYTPPWLKKQAARVTAPRGPGNATTRGFAKRKVACFRWSRRFNAQARDHWIGRVQCPQRCPREGHGRRRRSHACPRSPSRTRVRSTQHGIASAEETASVASTRHS